MYCRYAEYEAQRFEEYIYIYIYIQSFAVLDINFCLQGPGRVQPTKEDKLSLVKELRENSGPLSLTLELFQRYLDSNDDIQGESVSKLENGLFFYLQVQKFKVRW